MSEAVSRPSVTSETLVQSQTSAEYMEIVVENVVLREVLHLALRFPPINIIRPTLQASFINRRHYIILEIDSVFT
jgi:hypothetical protein